MANNFSYADDVKDNAARLKSKEQMLCKGLNIPYNATNSGSRKTMDIVHQTHALVLSRGEVPYIQTGYENRFGDHSSSILQLDRTYQVVAKIPKFSNAPDHHYYLILADAYSNTLHMVERVAYKHITEEYGYLINNSALDSVSIPGSVIRDNQILSRSTGFDQYMNKTNGANLNVVYMSLDDNMEDSCVISDVCSMKMRAPLLKKVRRVINENDIPLNLYGDNTFYKVSPDIGEDIKNGILFAFRREDKENAIYTQSVTRLQEPMMSDEKITLKGKVIDINIYCNNPANLANNFCNGQFNSYYQDQLRLCMDLVKVVSPYQMQGYELTYDLQKFFATCKDQLSGKEFIDKRKFSNITVEYIVMEELNLNVGDKVADRYGGKGVISKVVPQHLMPMLPNGQYADMIKNSHTMTGRENPGQIFEISPNFISMCILDHCRDNHCDSEQCMSMILKFLDIISPEEANDMRIYTSGLGRDEFTYFVGTILDHDCIHVSNEPISDRMDIDLIGELYEAFPWIEQQYLRIPIKGSDGQWRHINTRRKMVMGKQYIMRLKQLAEEKFSATSLSSTNIKNENAKSKASKNYRELHSNTPIRFGPMESGDMGHIGTDIVVMNLMLYSLSPIGRRLVEELYTGDPFDIDIRLNTKAKNRSVEQLNAKLKTMGYRFVFRKKRKIIKNAFTIGAISFGGGTPEEIEEAKKNERWAQNMKELEEIKSESAIWIDTLKFNGYDKDYQKDIGEENE